MSDAISAVRMPVVRLTSPYRGIEEFRYIDEPIFFGRDDDARDLLRLIMMYRGVLVYGDTGVGKSSLLNAKLMPRAVREGYTPERIRVQPKKGEEFIVERIAPDDGEVKLATIFQDDPAAMRISVSAEEFVRRTAAACAVEEPGGVAANYPLLIFDQFEELITLTEELPREARSSGLEATEAIEKALVRLLRDPKLCVKIVFVFREDYYAKLSRFFSAYPNLTDHALRIEPLHVDQLHAIIRGPFEVDGISFDHELSANVAAELEKEFRSRTDSDLINLTEVQIAAQLLWQHPDPAALLREQHVTGLLETYFTEAIDAVSPELHDAGVTLLGRMVTSSGTRNVVSVDDLMSTAREEGIPPDVAEAALRALDETAHVVRREARNDVMVYEILSEYLVPWIHLQKAEAQGVKRRREYEEEARRHRQKVWFAVAGVFGVLVVAMAIQWYRSSNTELGRRLSRVNEDYQILKVRFQQQQDELEAVQEELNRLKSSVVNERRLRMEALAAAQLAVQQRTQAQDLAAWANRFKEDTKAYAIVLERQRDALLTEAAPPSPDGVPASTLENMTRLARTDEFDRAVRHYLKDLEALRRELVAAQVKIKELEARRMAP